MSTTRLSIAFACCFILLFAGQAEGRRKCSGPVKYRVTFFNILTRRNPNFRTSIPKDGLVYSPMTAVTHSPRHSLFAVRGFAPKEVEMICETGNNMKLLQMARSSSRVKSAVGAMGPVHSGGRFTVEVTATCEQSYLTVLAMIAPSPDWIVQISNLPLMSRGRFIKKRFGRLFAYDCGTDDSGDFTPPSDLSLDRPTLPPKNIAPLFTDPTDPFGRYPVGYYKIERVRMRNRKSRQSRD